MKKRVKNDGIYFYIYENGFKKNDVYGVYIYIMYNN